MKDIYAYIDEFILQYSNDKSVEDLLNNIVEYFSVQFNVPTCKIAVEELRPVLASQGKIPPAYYKHGKDIINDSYLCFDTHALFSSMSDRQWGRIIKLCAHEWMHYYTALSKHKVINDAELNKKYKALILNSHSYSFQKLKNRYDDKKLLSALNKLSSLEIVADKFAMDFLNDIQKHTKNEMLKNNIRDQIQTHNEHIEYCRKIVSENCVNNEDVLSESYHC